MLPRTGSNSWTNNIETSFKKSTRNCIYSRCVGILPNFWMSLQVIFWNISPYLIILQDILEIFSVWLWFFKGEICKIISPSFLWNKIQRINHMHIYFWINVLKFLKNYLQIFFAHWGDIFKKKIFWFDFFEKSHKFPKKYRFISLKSFFISSARQILTRGATNNHVNISSICYISISIVYSPSNICYIAYTPNMYSIWVVFLCNTNCIFINFRSKVFFYWNPCSFECNSSARNSIKEWKNYHDFYLLKKLIHLTGVRHIETFLNSSQVLFLLSTTSNIAEANIKRNDTIKKTTARRAYQFFI